MEGSVFSAITSYLKDVAWGARSVFVSCFTVIPYLFGSGDLRKEVTEQYPDPISSKTPDDLPARFRGFLVNDIDRCTGCGDCAKACPVSCITIDAEPAAYETKIWVSRFDVDNARCIFCGICVEVCQPGSLSHSRQFEGSARDVGEMVFRFGRGVVTPEQRKKWAKIREQIDEDGAFS